jgi:hypothetical protein
LRLEPLTPARKAAYRRLAAAIVGLDVSSLASELQARRLGLPSAAHAA